MKKAIALAIAAVILAACADTRAHTNKNASSWEKIQYQADQNNSNN